MFWKIFFDSVAFILGILVVGWLIAFVIGRQKPTPRQTDSSDSED